VTEAGWVLIICAVIAAVAAVLAALITRVKNDTREIKIMVNGELHRALRELEIVKRRLRVIEELGIDSALHELADQQGNGK